MALQEEKWFSQKREQMHYFDISFMVIHSVLDFVREF
jgi:hypothetical protein